MFTSGNVNILAKPGMGDCFKDLKSSQNFDGIRCQRKAITPTNIMWQSWSKESGGTHLGVF